MAAISILSTVLGQPFLHQVLIMTQVWLSPEWGNVQSKMGGFLVSLCNPEKGTLTKEGLSANALLAGTSEKFPNMHIPTLTAREAATPGRDPFTSPLFLSIQRESGFGGDLYRSHAQVKVNCMFINCPKIDFKHPLDRMGGWSLPTSSAPP